jgi:hypothetical protein
MRERDRLVEPAEPPKRRPNPAAFKKGNKVRAGTKATKYLRKHIAAKHIMETKSKAITRKACELALAGDVTCIKLILERVVPVARPELTAIEDRIVALEIAKKGNLN